MSLPGLPVEVQRSILISLDYASLCQIRSSGRYFYNFLTEPEIHDVFLNIDIPKYKSLADYIPKPGQTCANCAWFCDVTAAQESETTARLKVGQEGVAKANEKVVVAIDDENTARKAFRKAKAAVKGVAKADKSKKEQKSKKRLVVQAEKEVRSTKEAVKAAQLEVSSARQAKFVIPPDMPNLRRACSICKRKHNGHHVPGVMALEASTTGEQYTAIARACSRTNHYVPLPGRTAFKDLQAAFKDLQKDGKICKICWKSGRRGAAGIQRRRIFIEEFGYWLRESWQMEGKALENKAKMLADKSFEDIEKEEAKVFGIKAMLADKSFGDAEKEEKEADAAMALDENEVAAEEETD